MANPHRRPNGIVWTTPPTATVEQPRGKGRITCARCRVGDCHLCTRVGCYHPCPAMRSAGVTATSEGAEHGAPGPGRRG